MSNFEIHVTVNRPELSLEVLELEDIAKRHGWKTSMIDGDPVLGEKVFFYFTSYASSMTLAFRKLKALTDILGDRVIREKIEEIKYDRRRP